MLDKNLKIFFNFIFIDRRKFKEEIKGKLKKSRRDKLNIDVPFNSAFHNMYILMQYLKYIIRNSFSGQI